MKIVDNRPIIQKQAYDLIVVGGGIAGVSAAVAASRHGVKTLILEKSIFLGGLLTSGLISYYEPLCDGNGKQMIFGIAEELMQLCIKDGFDNLSSDWKEKKEEHISRYQTYFSPTSFIMVLDEFVKENNVDVRFDSRAVFPVMEKNMCKGILVVSKGGREFYPAKTVIDATGDAEIADKAGVPTVVGKNWLLGMAHYTNKTLMENYLQDGKLHKFRKWLYAVDQTGKGEKSYKGITSEDITNFVIKGREMILKKIREENTNTREVMALPSMPQFRTIRRIVGKKVFCGIPEEKCDDVIGTCGDWRSSGRHYAIPYGSLYNPLYPNIFVAGRIISTDEGEGWEIARVAPVCSITGQAAGTAVAICLKNGYNSETMPVQLLQKVLQNDGIVIDNM